MQDRSTAHGESSNDPLPTLVATGRAIAARRPVSRLPQPIALDNRLSLSQALREQTDDSVVLAATGR